MDLSRLVQLVWIGGLAATPIVIGVSLLCRSQKLRPATKHALWAAALASFLTPLAVAAVWRNTWFASDRVLSLADRVLPEGPRDAKGAARIEPGADASESANAGAEAMEAPAKASDVMGSPRAVDVPAKLMATSEPRVPIATPTVETTPSRSTPVELMNECGIQSKPVARSVSQHGVEHGALAGLARPHGPEDRSVTPMANQRGMNDQSTARASDAGEKASITGSVSRSTRMVLEKLVAVRDAIADLPPVPIYAWIGIAALLVLLRMFRSVTLRRIVNRARPAPRRMRELVSDMAGVMGLASPPETLTTESRISPMVWCGVRPKLVIPEDLWASLDNDSRRAVIAHELAHLKRRDHLLHWIAALVAAAYWWHPAAWWTRRKMNEEAEASCDAWVTSLFPRRRRAYAEALLVTSSFLGSPAYHAGPALGVVDGRTKLARRITMVMTQRTAPNASKIGVIVASLVLATGALVTPGLACPPEKEAKAPKHAEGGAFLGEAPAIDALIRAEKAQAEKAAKSKNKAKRKMSGQTTILMPGAAATAPAEAATIYRDQAAEGVARAYTLDRAQVEQAQSLAKVYADLATRNYDGAKQNQDRAAANRERAARDAERAAMRQMEAFARVRRAPGAASGLSTTMAPTAPIAPLAPMAPMPAMPPSPPAHPTPMGPYSGHAPATATQPAPLMDAFGGAATISGPAEGTEPREYRLPPGKLESLSELMARQDVPIWIERGQGKIVVHATAEQHEVFAAFIKMINPEGSTGAGASMGGVGPALTRSLLGQTRAAASANLEQLRAHLEALESQRDHREQHLDSLRQRAEEMREKAESLREMADELREKASESSNEAARDALRQAEQALSAESSGLDNQATDIEAQAAAVESEFESMESAIASLESQIESMEESDLAAITTDVEPGVLSHDGLFLTTPVEVVAPAAEDENADADGPDGPDADDDDEETADELVIPSDVLEPAPAPAPTSPTTPTSL